MKLIEKKCPNCGASLEFNENDKSCVCNYCHRSFEIERDTSKLDELKEAQYVLNEIMKKNTFSPFFFIIPIIVFAGFIFVFFNIFRYVSNDIHKETLIKDVSELTNNNYELLKTEAIFEIENAIGETNKSSFQVEERTREKVYIAYKKDSNYLIAIYKVKYKDFFNQSDIQTIYVPITYENIKYNYNSLTNAKIDAPEYYFNKEKTTYAYGYASFDEAYNNVVKPLKKEYTITEK